MKAQKAGKCSIKLLLSLAGLLLFLVTPAVRADEGDPPNRVARISVLEGNVSFQAAGAEDWGAAAMNRPVTIGDKVWSDKDSRAELQAGQATIHLGSMTALSFLNLDESTIQMRMAEGGINFRVRELRQGDVYEVDTPNAAFTVKEAGDFRIDVNENGDATRIAVIRGSGEVAAGGQAYEVQAGQSAEFSGIENVQYSAGTAPEPDGLDKWADSRDLREDSSQSARYVSRDVPGYSDLDQYGTWSEQPDVGPIWYPNDIPSGWAPYSNGYWSYVGPWGWTWVDYAPWGFAPFHYGRWGWYGGRWGWGPGPYPYVGGYPFYGPAFVGFLGGGVGFGFGFGLGIGWFPLGFGEPFHPWYHASYGYIHGVNFANSRFSRGFDFNSGRSFNYAYAHNANAVSATSRNGFTSGQAVNRGAAHITDASLRGASVNNNMSGLSPAHGSTYGAANSHANVSRPSASVQGRINTGRGASTATARSGAAGSSGSSGARQNQLSQNRPSGSANSGSRSWSAQGNQTTGGRAPQGFGRANSPSNGAATQTARAHPDRPPGAGSGLAARSGSSVSGGANRSATTGGSRSYAPSSRSYSGQSGSTGHSYSPQPGNRGGNSAPRSYSAPSYGGNRGSSGSAPPRSYAPPNRSYSSPHGSSGGSSSSHGSSGGSRGGGGSRTHR